MRIPWMDQWSEKFATKRIIFENLDLLISWLRLRQKESITILRYSPKRLQFWFFTRHTYITEHWNWENEHIVIVYQIWELCFESQDLQPREVTFVQYDPLFTSTRSATHVGANLLFSSCMNELWPITFYQSNTKRRNKT